MIVLATLSIWFYWNCFIFVWLNFIGICMGWFGVEHLRSKFSQFYSKFIIKSYTIKSTTVLSIIGHNLLKKIYLVLHLKTPDPHADMFSLCTAWYEGCCRGCFGLLPVLFLRCFFGSFSYKKPSNNCPCGGSVNIRILPLSHFWRVCSLIFFSSWSFRKRNITLCFQKVF